MPSPPPVPLTFAVTFTPVAFSVKNTVEEVRVALLIPLFGKFRMSVDIEVNSLTFVALFGGFTDITEGLGNVTVKVTCRVPLIYPLEEAVTVEVYVPAASPVEFIPKDNNPRAGAGITSQVLAVLVRVTVGV